MLESPHHSFAQGTTEKSNCGVGGDDISIQ